MWCKVRLMDRTFFFSQDNSNNFYYSFVALSLNNKCTTYCIKKQYISINRFLNCLVYLKRPVKTPGQSTHSYHSLVCGTDYNAHRMAKSIKLGRICFCTVTKFDHFPPTNAPGITNTPWIETQLQRHSNIYSEWRNQLYPQ